MSDCPKCGAANPDGATFCGLCAQPFTDKKPQESPQVNSRAEKVPWSSLDHVRYPTRQAVRRHKYVSFGVPILVVVIAVLAVVLVMSIRTNKVEGSSEFKSSSSGISFKYPASWEKQGKSFLTHLSSATVRKTIGSGAKDCSSTGRRPREKGEAVRESVQRRCASVEIYR